MAKTPRPVRRVVHFTLEEHAELAARAKLARLPFSRFLREAALAGRVVVPATRFDRALLADLARVGNNLNQLAREANAARAFPSEAKVNAVLGPLGALIEAMAPVPPARRSAGQFPTADGADAAGIPTRRDDGTNGERT